MKLVAQRDIYNSKPFNVKVSPTLPDGKADPLFQHEQHIHKGARFTIGQSDVYKDLSAGPNGEQFIVGTLIKYGIAVLDIEDNVKNGVIPKIDREAKQELEARKKASAKQLSAEELIGAAVAKAVSEAMIAFKK